MPGQRHSDEGQPDNINAAKKEIYQKAKYESGFALSYLRREDKEAEDEVPRENEGSLVALGQNRPVKSPANRTSRDA